MTKEELVYLTLRQLSESLKTHPENFRLEDPSIGSGTGNAAFPGPTIIWQFKVKVSDNELIPDPFNATKTIIITYNKIAKQIHCHIYHREVNNLNHAIMPEAQATIQFHDYLPLFFHRTYREFKSLRTNLIKRRNEKEYIDYMRRLHGIFPSIHEEELFK